MIIHLFNATIVSGPETLVIPALGSLAERMRTPVEVWFLHETRRAAESSRVLQYAQGFGLKTRSFDVRSRWDRAAIRALGDALGDGMILHAHDVKASAYARAAVLARRRESPFAVRLVSTHHGVRGRSGWRSKLYEWFYVRWVLRDFDRVLAVCTSDRALLIQRGLNAGRVVVHLNGVDREETLFSARADRQRRLRDAWGLEHDRIWIGFVGRLAPEKRLDRILRVLQRLEQDHPKLPDWGFAAFGSGPLLLSVQQETRALGLEPRVRWMGYRQGVGAELAGFDVLLSLSDAEGLPINLIEAGWAATPVLATDVDGNRDLMPESDEGIRVDPNATNSEIANALARMILDAGLRDRMGKKFQERVRREFSGKRWVENLEAIYRSL